MKKLIILIVLITTFISGCAPLTVDEDIDRINDFGFAITNEKSQYHFIKYETDDTEILDEELDYETPFMGYTYTPSSNSYNVEILTNVGLYYSYDIDSETNEISNAIVLPQSFLTQDIDIEDNENLNSLLEGLDDYDRLTVLFGSLLENVIPNKYIYSSDELQKMSLDYIYEINSTMYNEDYSLDELGISVNEDLIINTKDSIVEIGAGAL